MDNRNRNPLAGIAGLLSLAGIGSSERDARRNLDDTGSADGQPSPDDLAAFARSMGMPEDLMKALGLVQDPTAKADAAVREELAKFGGDTEAALNDSIAQSRAAGKLVGVLALSAAAAALHIEDERKCADLNNGKADPSFKEVTERVFRNFIVAETSFEDVMAGGAQRGPRVTDETKRRAFELAAEVLWGNTIKGIRAMAALAQREGYAFEPNLGKVALSNPAWSLIDAALELDGDEG